MRELKNVQHVIEDNKPKVIITFKDDKGVFHIGFDNPPITKEDELNKQVAWATKEIKNWQIK